VRGDGSTPRKGGAPQCIGCGGVRGGVLRRHLAGTAKGCGMASCGSGRDLVAFAGDVTFFLALATFQPSGALGDAASSWRIVAM
jgi:hypothetical protein